MDRLSQYCMEVRRIGGVETYLISPGAYGALAGDGELLSALGLPSERLRRYMDGADGVSLFFAITHHANRAVRFQWEPVLCYRDGEDFHHVGIRSSWKCRDCGHIHEGPVLLPMCEYDPPFYAAGEAPLPPCFQKLRCARCGHLLQNHLLFLREPKARR